MEFTKHMKVYLGSTNNGNASWTINGRQGPRQGMNWRVAKLWIVLIILNLILVKKFIPRQLLHGCRYCCINNTNELSLLVNTCFCVKKESTGGQISSKKQCIRIRTSVFVSSPQPLHHMNEWIASFNITLFKLRNYGNYVHVYTHFISRWN